MKILYIHQYFTTPEGAAGTRSYEFARRLVQQGHKVTMLCGHSQYTRASGADGIRVVQVGASASNTDSFPRRAWGFLKFSLLSSWHALWDDYDLIYATSTPLTVALPGLVGKHLRGKPFIFEVRDLWPELPRAMGIIRNRLLIRLLEAFEGFTYRSADACIGLAPGIVEAIRRKAPRTRVELIPNGCDLAAFRPSAEKGVAATGIAPDQFVALFCGAHGRANGLDAALDAAAILRQTGRADIRILLVGDGQLKQGLVDRARREQLDNVVFMDPVPKRELASLMARCHCGLMLLADVEAFQYGTSPNKFFDYISCGLPVVCNYPGWLADLITGWRCGAATPSGDPAALAAALAAMADDRGRAADMGRQARRLAEAEFGRDHLFTRLEKLIHQFHPHA